MKDLLIRKLTSRKFFSLLTGLVVSILIAFKVDENTVAEVVAIIGATASVVSYIFAEAYVDGQREKANTK